MFFDFRAGEDFSAQFADFTHLWIGIVLFMCGPGGAHFTRRLQAAVLNQSQADTHTHGDQVQESIEQACGGEKVSFRLEEIEDDQNAAGFQRRFQFQNHLAQRQMMQGRDGGDAIKMRGGEIPRHGIGNVKLKIRKLRGSRARDANHLGRKIQRNDVPGPLR